ncbi:acetyltransferase [Chryseobacterium sp. G0162]|uniref:acetyltransferase n=1 Tax=Chryseobacterium sp. G0162 TaxID=2487063 RepID=UPI000F4E8E14|nr:acetyltransferase [Chryseobacterium sp. G0162]AZB07638.1 acetyltransferase [Chryseobacterium sp. G0162]
MYLYGASGHGKVVLEIAEENGYNIEGFIDEDISKIMLLNYTVTHSVPLYAIDVVITIGNNKIRKKIVNGNPLFNYMTLIHPKTTVSKRVKIGEGTVVMPGCKINSEVNVGKHCIINTNASVDHDCAIEDFVHISPGASLAGAVSVGEGTHIGIGAVVIQGVNIGKWCTIGAGAVIIRDVLDGATVVGNPGRVIKMNESKYDQ